MAEWQLEGRPDDDLLPETGDDDDAVEGTVVPFPRPSGQPAPAARKAAPGQRGEVRDVIPEHLRTLAGIRKAVMFWVRRWRRIILFHLVRLPKMLAQACAWAPVGAARIEMAAWSWAFVTEQAYLRGLTIEAGDIRQYLQVHKDGKETRLFRVSALGLAHVAALALGAAATVSLPLAVLGIAEMNKALRDDPDGAIVPLGPVMSDGAGWLAQAELPPGVTAGQVSEKRENLAAALRRPLGCVWPETMHKRHPGALSLFVSDEDMNTAPMPAWPLARRGQADMFRPAGFAVDPRGREVTITLMYVSVIIGSLPRMGKTFCIRLLLMICALDVRSEIHAYDLKGTGDLAPLRPVAHRYRAGDEPEDMDYLMADLRALRTEMRRRA